MKEIYASPEMEVIEFESEDVICTSGDPGFSLPEIDI